MKKISFFLMAMLVSLTSFATEVSIDLSAQGYTNGQEITSVSLDDAVTVAFNKGTNNNTPKYYNTGKAVRVYGGGYFTITTTTGQLTKIELTFSSGEGTNEITVDAGSYATGTWTGQAGTVKFTVGGTSGHRRIQKIAVTYGEVTADYVAAPSISGDVDFIESTEVSIAAGEGLKVYYTLDGTDPTNASPEYTASFEVKETTTVKAIAYNGENSSEVASQTFTKATEVTCAEAKEIALKVSGNNVLTELTYVVKGYVTNIVGDWESGKQTFWIADTKDGGNVFEAYFCYTSKAVVLGDYVQLYGKLTKFNSTPEMSNGQATILPAPVAKFNVTVTAENGTVEGAGEYEENAEATLTATAAEGYEFTCWTSGEDTVSTANPYTFAVTANVALVANFKEVVVEEPVEAKLYLTPNANWKQSNARFAAYFFGNGETWVGMTKVDGETDLYEVTIPTDKKYPNVIFCRMNPSAAANNWNNKWNQTDDLVIPTDGKNHYTVKAGTWDKGGGTWSIWPVPTVKTYVDITITVTANAPASIKWANAGDKLADATEYVAMTAGENNTYTYTLAQVDEVKGVDYTVKVGEAVSTTQNTSKNVTADFKALLPQVAVQGVNNWDGTDKMTIADDYLTASITLPLVAKKYDLKLTVDATWKGTTSNKITRENNSSAFTGDSGNGSITADIAGDYVFTYTYATQTLTVTYPALTVKYNVTVTAENGTVEGAGEYEENAEATLTATPAEGYEFTCWTSGEDTVSTANPYTFAVTANVALVANFNKKAEPEHTYTVAGSSEAAFGTAWDPENADNDMKKQEDGTYKWEKEGLELLAGEVEFKVTEDHAWTVAYPAQNYKLAIAETGIYTLTITFNPADQAVAATATKTGDVVIIPTIAMHGNFLGSWADTENFTLAADEATATLTLTIAEGNYEFGMRIGGSGNWTSNGVAFTRENASAEIVAGAGNLTLAADVAGEYTFTWTYATNTLTVTYPVVSEPEYEIYEVEIKDLVIDLDNLALIGSANGQFQVAVTLGLGEYNRNEDTYQLIPESSVEINGTEATFVEGYASVNTFDQTATAVVRCVWNGMNIELRLNMSAAPLEATVVVVENAVIEIEKVLLFGDMYDYALKMTGEWVNPEDGLTYPVLVEVPVYYPESTEPSEITSTVTVGGWGDEDPWLGFGEGTLTITTVDDVITATGVVQNPMAGIAIDITISGTITPSGVENATVTINPVKMIQNGQLIIIKNDVQYNAQGAKL